MLFFILHFSTSIYFHFIYLFYFNLYQHRSVDRTDGEPKELQRGAPKIRKKLLTKMAEMAFCAHRLATRPKSLFTYKIADDLFLLISSQISHFFILQKKC